MKLFSAAVLGAAILLAPLLSLSLADRAAAETPPLTQKLNAYVGCINRLSARAYDSRRRYFSWVGKKGPTGRERIIYGTYTIYDTADCRKAVEKANAMAPHDAALEAAASAYAAAVSALAPLLKEADDYYTQQDYKDDRMAKGKALHPRLVAAWNAFAHADQTLRNAVDAINDKRKAAALAEIEKSEGRKARYYVEALMIDAKRVLQSVDPVKPNLAEITRALSGYETAVKGAEPFSGNGLTDSTKIGSSFVSSAKSYLVTAKLLMRRLRDHVPYSQGDKMMLSSGGGWMVEGSPARLLRDYNQLVDAYNRGARF